MVKLPFEEIDEGNSRIRTFSKDSNDHELKWHFDKEDRFVELLEDTDWEFQFDNDLPVPFPKKIIIPKNEWHRVIKGNKDLKIRIKTY